MLASGLNGDQEEKDIQMDVFVYVAQPLRTLQLLFDYWSQVSTSGVLPPVRLNY